VSYEHITLDIADGIATITLNRPDKLNAFTGTMMPRSSRASWCR